MTKTNEYILPKEKPFETVCEIKDEYQVPSFEEFVKTYEGGVNYADLSGGDVGEVKGYGPCSEGGCSYEDKECQCFIGQRRVPLYLVCPVPKYRPPYYCSDTTAGQWYHKDCGGRMFINDDLNIKCMKYDCGRNGPIENWSFACASHPGKYDWASAGMFEYALGYLDNIWKNNDSRVGRRLIEKMIEKVMDDPSRFRYS
jgi:hypothetical protein